MDGQFSSGVSLGSGFGSNSTGGADSENSASQSEFAGRGLSILPDEMVVKVLSNLNFSDISVCRCVNHRWRALIDAYHLRALSFCRRLHYRPIRQTVEHYHSFTKNWLTGFSNEGKELAGRLDTLLEHQNFSEILFFSTAELHSRVKSLTCQNVFTGYHSGPIERVSFSPNGRYFATASQDHSAKIWELVGGQWQENATIEHSGTVNNASFSPDGSRLVTASGDGYAKIWELVAGKWQEMATLWHSSEVTNASFSPDKYHLATASLEGNTKIWKLVAGQWQEKFTVQHFTRVVTANFSPDGSHLVSASFDRKAKVCGLDAAGQWQQKATFQHPGRVYSVSFSPDGSHFVTASFDQTAKVFGIDAAGQWLEHSTIWHENMMLDARFSPDGRIITTSECNSATIWRLVDGKWLEEADIEHSDWVIDVCFTPNGRLLATTSYDNTVKIWGHFAGQWQEKAIVSGFSEENPVYTASLSPDGSHLVTTFADETVIIWLLKSKGGEDIS